MKIAEAVKAMTIQYLSRVLDSFTSDIGRLDVEDARDYIVRNAEELAKPENVQRRLNLFEIPEHSQRRLCYFILETLINAPDCELTEHDLVERVREREENLIAEAKDEDALKYADSKALEIFRPVLEVALEDGTVSHDEYRLLLKLRQRLGLTRKQQQILEAELESFPKPGGKLHSRSDIKSALNELQKNGVLFYCNRAEGRNYLYVIPEELKAGVKSALDIELSETARELLWKNLPNATIRDILRSQGLPVYGAKDELVRRLMFAETSPSEGLSGLLSDDLYTICDSLPGVNVSGTKQERIERIIRHFDNLMIREVPEDASPGELFYEYFVQLANRDRENLLANDVISKDLDIERAFETATRYLFIEKLGLSLEETSGSDNPDGCVLLPDDTLFMWDNKSSEGDYRFPNSHLRQFKRYIRDSIQRRVNVFMVIVPDVKAEAEDNCLRLKFESQHDTDVCIVKAEDLKWAAETWSDKGSDKPFNLAVFNQTGIMRRSRIEQSMKVLL